MYSPFTVSSLPFPASPMFCPVLPFPVVPSVPTIDAPERPTLAECKTASPGRPAVATARPLAAEQRHLRLHRDDHDAAIAAVVKSLDHRLDPSASAVQAGTLEKFTDLHGGGTRVAYVYTSVGGHDYDIIISFPMRADTLESARAVEEAVATIRDELELR